MSTKSEVDELLESAEVLCQKDRMDLVLSTHQKIAKLRADARALAEAANGLTPLMRLPREILTEIVRLAVFNWSKPADPVDDFGRRGLADHDWILPIRWRTAYGWTILGHVCRLLRNILRADPTIWANTMTLFKAQAYSDMEKLAGSLPVRVRAGRNMEERCIYNWCYNGWRIHEMDLSLAPAVLARLRVLEECEFPNLRSLHLRLVGIPDADNTIVPPVFGDTFPILSDLTVARFNIEQFVDYLGSPSCLKSLSLHQGFLLQRVTLRCLLEILQQTPLVERLELDRCVITYPGLGVGHPTKKVELSRLRILRLCETPTDCLKFLQSVDIIPSSLAVLDIVNPYNLHTDVRSLLGRLAPLVAEGGPLRSLLIEPSSPSNSGFRGGYCRAWTEVIPFSEFSELSKLPQHRFLIGFHDSARNLDRLLALLSEAFQPALMELQILYIASIPRDPKSPSVKSFVTGYQADLVKGAFQHLPNLVELIITRSTADLLSIVLRPPTNATSHTTTSSDAPCFLPRLRRLELRFFEFSKRVGLDFDEFCTALRVRQDSLVKLDTLVIKHATNLTEERAAVLADLVEHFEWDKQVHEHPWDDALNPRPKFRHPDSDSEWDSDDSEEAVEHGDWVEGYEDPRALRGL